MPEHEGHGEIKDYGAEQLARRFEMLETAIRNMSEGMASVQCELHRLRQATLPGVMVGPALDDDTLD